MKARAALIGIAIGTNILACGTNPPAERAAPDPVLGSWVLNMGKSTFAGGIPPFTGQTVTFDSGSAGITVTTETTNRDGTVLRSAYTARYDGKRYPISGAPNVDSVSFARLDARTVERFDTKGDTFVGSVTRVVSPDGRTLTVMSKPMGAQGRTVGNILVYDRQ